MSSFKSLRPSGPAQTGSMRLLKALCLLVATGVIASLQARSNETAPPVVPPAGASPGGVPPAGPPPGGMPPAGAPPAGMPPAGALPAGMPPAGALPAGMPPAGALPAGMPPAGAPPAEGFPPAGVPPAGVPPEHAMHHMHHMHHMHPDAHAHAHAHWQQMYDHYYGAGGYHGMHHGMPHPHQAHAFHPHPHMMGTEQGVPPHPADGAFHNPPTPPPSNEIQTHSWEAPLTQENLSQWDVAMSSSPSQDHIVLMPGAPNRTGQLWHRQPVPGENSEIQFGFSVEGMKDSADGAAKTGTPGGFAFWYVYEPYNAVYPKTNEDQAAWNLFGYKRNPKGLGVFFKFLDHEGRPNPSISCVHNTADDRNIEAELPGPNALFYQYRNKPSPVQFRVFIGNYGVVAQIRDSPQSDWLTACNIEDLLLRPGGFIGFTSYNGNNNINGLNGNNTEQETQGAGKTGSQQAAADQVLLHFVKVWNLDVKPGAHDHYGHGFGGFNHANFHQHHADPYQIWQSQAFQEHYQAEQSLMKLLTSMESQIKTLTIDLQALHERLGGTENPDFVRSIKSDITGLTNLFKRHSQQQTSTLHNIHKSVEGSSGTAKAGDPSIVSQLTDISSQLEKNMAMRLAHNLMLSGGAIFLVLIFIIFVWKKFNDMEKKHML